jgi:hypothetical protein
MTAEWRVKGLDEGFAKRVKEFRRGRGLTLKGLLVGAVLGVMEGEKGDQRGTKESPKGDQKGTKKFAPPTEAEADAEIAAKGYHFGTGRDFVAWYATRGWRTKEGPMKDWKQAMVTWESRWRTAQQLKLGKRLPQDEVEEIRRKLAAQRGVKGGG